VSASDPAAVIILAAGEGTRMKTRTPKVLHRVCGRTMLGHVLATARELSPARLIVVTGHAHGEVGAELAEQAPDATVVVQERRGGTGHAVRTVIESVGLIRGTIVVTYADTPLLRSQTLAELIAVHESGGAAVTVLTALVDDPAGYGRIIRDSSGDFAQIVEHADATPAQRAIKEINSGVYAFDGELLADVVKRVPTDNVKGEEYLTDAVGLLRGDGHPVASVQCGDPDEVLGVNDQAQLAWARRVLNERVLDRWMRAGVTIHDPGSTWIDVGVRLEPDTEIGPGTQLEGQTQIAARARIGPGCLLRDTTVAAGATVIQSVCESAVVGPGASVGPFAHLVPGTKLAGGQRVAGQHPAAAGSGQPATPEIPPRPQAIPPRPQAIPPRPQAIPPRPQAIPPRPQAIPPRHEGAPDQ
jgi:bifunctional UDP-N-acetylglucosamine pyrophosphorylase/glucosamine-1-phosphate N-acetyltransferase